VKFLVDANLSPRLSAAIMDEGHDSTHVAEIEMQGAADEEIFERAAAQSEVIVTADSDFGMLLAFSRAASPSVLQLRDVAELRTDAHIRLVVSNLPSVVDVLQAGAVVSLSPDRIRIRELPIER